jgi:hypothetical protein
LRFAIPLTPNLCYNKSYRIGLKAKGFGMETRFYTLGARRLELHPDVAPFAGAGCALGLDDLIASMQAGGYDDRYPILVCEDGNGVSWLVDGARRIEAIGLAGIDPQDVSIRIVHGDVFGEWQRANMARRHYSTSVRAALAVQALPHYQARAKARQGRAGEGAGEAVQQAALAFSTNAEYVRKAAALKQSHPDLFADVLTGRNKLTLACAMATVSAQVLDVIEEHKLTSPELIKELQTQYEAQTATWHSAAVGVLEVGDSVVVKLADATVRDVVEAQQFHKQEARAVHAAANDYKHLIIEATVTVQDDRLVFEEHGGEGAIARWLRENGRANGDTIKVQLKIKGENNGA